LRAGDFHNATEVADVTALGSFGALEFCIFVRLVWGVGGVSGSIQALLLLFFHGAAIFRNSLEYIVAGLWIATILGRQRCRGSVRRVVLQGG
jgi:hypothetical protein